jgi:hypothetical protein
VNSSIVYSDGDEIDAADLTDSTSDTQPAAWCSSLRMW